MPKFILKFKMRGRPNRDRPDRIVDGDDVLLGSRPLADVYVPDRLVPQEAVSFQFDGVHLAMDVRTRLAGVFVDGRPVDGQGHVKSGSTIQIGHALVEVVVDAAKGECTLTTNEQHLAAVVDGIVTKTKPAKPFALVDPGPQEHRWGKSAVLSTSNWLAAVVGLALCAAFPFLKDTETLSRGELFRAHAVGSAGGPKDCAGCHAPMSSDYGPKCAACHKGLDSTTTHPYARAGEVSCNACHAEHVGADADIVPSMKQTDSGWPATCLRCHAGQPYPAAADLPAATVAVAKTRLRDMRGDAFSRQLLVDGFSHNDHRVPKPGGVVPVPGGAPKRGAAPIACTECHKLLGPKEKNRAIPTAEFAAVRYAKCLECHAEWRVEIHGRDEAGKACYECHAKADSPEEITSDLKMIELPATESKWVLKPRDHDFKKDECVACHVLSKSSLDHRTPAGPKVFRHDHHLRTVTPPAGGELAFSQECRACHDALAGSMSLGGTPVVNTTSCAKCHVDSEPTPVPAKEGAKRRVVDMVHKVHTVDAASLSRSAMRYTSRDALARGCLSCHEPVAGEAPMTFKEGAKDCKACHTGHENLGEGKCVFCHVDRAPGKNRELNGRLEFRHSEPGIFDKEKATTKTTAAMKRFDHRSVGHAGHECGECHRAETIDGASRVLDVLWPAFDDDACVKCHVRERFHR